jgi:hypothetical protein
MNDKDKVVMTDFNWVAARAECSPIQVAERLRLQIANDLEIRKSLMTPVEQQRYRFSMASEGRRFSVSVDGNDVYRGVRFSLVSDGIVVHNVVNDALLHEARLTLSNDGECRLKVGEKEYDLWQFRKLVLEDIFFGL